MTRIAILVTALATATSAAFAKSSIDALCGPAHVNEVAAADDVTANPDGFNIRSLQTQLSHGDPRILPASGNTFHLCTASAATPDMDRTKALLLMNERRVKYLFVPNECRKGGSIS
ncbi:hypothetical protein [Yoonia sp. SS1-5]|uniref:Uncharacterized protein n=1 Tax=Yoonia rhodophyticola TaxID=3137370 RepID=A0AAN0MFI2_9RHOB